MSNEVDTIWLGRNADARCDPPGRFGTSFQSLGCHLFSAGSLKVLYLQPFFIIFYCVDLRRVQLSLPLSSFSVLFFLFFSFLIFFSFSFSFFTEHFQACKHKHQHLNSLAKSHHLLTLGRHDTRFLHPASRISADFFPNPILRLVDWCPACMFSLHFLSCDGQHLQHRPLHVAASRCKLLHAASRRV